MQTQDTASLMEENIVDVTPSALISLTSVLSLLAAEGITKIYVPGYLPLRWDAKSEMYRKKIEYYKKQGSSKQEIDNIASQFWEEQLRIGRNITDKMMRNFMRLKYHFEGLEIYAHPLEVDDFMHLHIIDELKGHNPDHLLSNILDKINTYENHKQIK